MESPNSTTTRPQRPTYVDEARSGEAGWPRYLLGLVIILASFVGIGGAVTQLLVALITSGFGGFAPGPLAGFVVTMAPFPFFLAGIVLTVTRVHSRRVRTLVTARERIDRRRVGLGFVVWFVLFCLFQLGYFVLNPGVFSVNPDLAPLLLFVPLALVLTAVQTTTEELFFRGYVVQAASIVWANRAFLALVSAVIFTLPHLLNPEASAGGWLTVFFGYFVGTGLIWVVVSLVDGTTELAIGAHFANNIANILLVGTAGTVVSTPALVTVAAYDPVVGVFSTVTIVPLFAATALWCRRRADTGARDR